MIVVYIAGPFRGPNAWEIEQNIRRAEALALAAWRLGGIAVICPHTNTRFFHNAAPDDIWLEGDLEILRRCDAVLTTDDWTRSSGAVAEVEEASRRNLLIFRTLDELRGYLAVRARQRGRT
jgi:hypothetical protein